MEKTSLSKWVALTIVIVFGSAIVETSGAGETPSTRWKLLQGYVDEPAKFKELEIGNRIVYWYPRRLGEAIVEKDQIVFRFDRETQELIDVKRHWREDLPASQTN